MKYDAKRYAQALLDLSAGKTKNELAGVMENWFNLISERRQDSLLPQISQELEALFDIDQVAVTVESAKALDKKTKDWLADYLTTIITDKKIIITEKLNPDLLSGYLIKYQDKELNLSLNGILNDLRSQIIA